MSIIISNIDFSDARPGFDFEGDFRLGNRNQTQRFCDVIRKCVRLQTLAASCIGFAEKIGFADPLDQASFYPATIAPYDQVTCFRRWNIFHPHEKQIVP